MARTGILVVGHTRLELLKNTLESLARQAAIDRTHVWLDGHEGFSELLEPVYKCRSIADHFVSTRLVAYNGRVGVSKLAVDGLWTLSHQYDRLIFLEDDSFPTYSAVRVFEEGIEEISNDPEIFSVYGHHFLVPAEGETITRFQCWGWATTTAKLRPVLEEARRCLSWPEPRFLRWIENLLTPDVCVRLSVTPPRDPIQTIRTFFALDAFISVLTASMGLTHRKTSRRVVYNCGMGNGSSHFTNQEQYRRPPFNMILPSEVWQVWED